MFIFFFEKHRYFLPRTDPCRAGPAGRATEGPGTYRTGAQPRCGHRTWRQRQRTGSRMLALGNTHDEAMSLSRFSTHLKESIRCTGVKYRPLTKTGSVVPAVYVYEEREGVNPKGNLNNGILFSYINKCSENSQTLVHCCKKLVQFFFH